MTLEDFVLKFANLFDDTDVSEFAPSTEYKNLEEWDSMTGLSIIAMANKEFGKKISGMEVHKTNTIEDLFNLIQSK